MYSSEPFLIIRINLSFLTGDPEEITLENKSALYCGQKELQCNNN